MSERLGVGLAGAGAVTQGIHLPTLATLPEQFAVTRVMDVDAGVAATVAGRAGAAHSTSLDALLADPSVDVVAICSPPTVHADQVEAACAAGKRAVLCEKPLATSVDEGDRIVEASRRTGVPVIAGTMLVYDPAYRAAAAVWGDLPAGAHFVRSSIVLPLNDRFIDAATQLRADPAPVPRPQDPDSPEAIRARLTGMILGLLSHHIPLVRDFAPHIDHVEAARVLAPFGYEITLRSGSCTVHLIATMHRHWQLDWSFEVWGSTGELHAGFPPSFVPAGSATTVLRDVDGAERRWRFGHENGYQAEWRHLHDVATGTAPARVGAGQSADDLRYALTLAALAGDAATENR